MLEVNFVLVIPTVPRHIRVCDGKKVSQLLVTEELSVDSRRAHASLASNDQATRRVVVLLILTRNLLNVVQLSQPLNLAAKGTDEVTHLEVWEWRGVTQRRSS